MDTPTPTTGAATGTGSETASKFGNVTHGIVLSASGLEAVVSSLAKGTLSLSLSLSLAGSLLSFRFSEHGGK